MPYQEFPWEWCGETDSRGHAMWQVGSVLRDMLVFCVKLVRSSPMRMACPRGVSECSLCPRCGGLVGMEGAAGSGIEHVTEVWRQRRGMRAGYPACRLTR